MSKRLVNKQHSLIMPVLGFIVLVFLVSVSPVNAAVERIALVIGNGAYSQMPLLNPRNDATDMAARLESFGFTVTRLIDEDQRTIERAIVKFTGTLNKDTVGLFYFAGHGLQVEGENYLVPIGAQIEREEDARYEAVALGRVIDGMRRSGSVLNLVVLDACRNNPFARSFRSANRGLARASPASGTMILYATEPGNVAADGVGGRNGVFTEGLLAEMDETPDAEVEQLFKHTAARVFRATRGKQSPWSEGVIRGTFRFGAGSAKPEIPAEPVQITELPARSLELPFWQSAERGNTVEEYRAYLERYSGGTFVGIAKARIRRLENAKKRALVNESVSTETQPVTESSSVQIIRESKSHQDQLALARYRLIETQLGLGREQRRKIQLALNALEFNVGAVDGLWGPRTRVAIRLWQNQENLEVTGYVDSDSYKLLVAELPVEPVSTRTEKSRRAFEPRMVIIKTGSFQMGSEYGEGIEKPVHEVTIKSFELGQYEVTFDEYDVFAKATGRAQPKDRGWGRAQRPVINVSWNDAKAYVAWLSQETGREYRLPSEAEWEYSARAGSLTTYSFGDSESELCLYANGDGSTCNDDYQYTAPVGSLQPNIWGLYDMHGNVSEWVEDCWHWNYIGAPADGSPWTSVDGGGCERPVQRGGGWNIESAFLRSTYRSRYFMTDKKYAYIGFRVARTLTPAEAVKAAEEQRIGNGPASKSSKPRNQPQDTFSENTVSSVSSISANEMNTVLGHFFKLKSAFETVDLQTVTDSVIFSQAREDMMSQLFERYQSIKTSISNINISKSAQTISAQLRIIELTRANGETVQPSSVWRDIAISATRTNGEWSKIRW